MFGDVWQFEEADPSPWAPQVSVGISNWRAEVVTGGWVGGLEGEQIIY